MSKNYIVTGTQMKNKGSQAMLIAAIDGLRSVHPDCNVTCFMFKKSDLNYDCNYKLLPWTRIVRLLLFFHINRIPVLSGIIEKKLSLSFESLTKTIQEADAIVDASGYTIGSAWSAKANWDYVISLLIAKRYKKPVYLLPQSFGPFDNHYSRILKWIVRRTLQNVKVIYSREADGQKELNKIGINHVKTSLDLVIRDTDFGLCSLMDSDQNPDYSQYADYVGVVINENLFRRTGDNIYDLYCSCIRTVLQKGMRVIVIKTSDKDDAYLTGLRELLKDEKRIVWMTESLNAMQLNTLIGTLRFIIASRYHSIVFALRNGVPAIALGWSVKYEELLKAFELDEFCLNLHELSPEAVLAMIERMAASIERYRHNTAIRAEAARTELFKEFLI